MNELIVKKLEELLNIVANFDYDEDYGYWASESDVVKTKEIIKIAIDLLGIKNGN